MGYERGGLLRERAFVTMRDASEIDNNFFLVTFVSHNESFSCYL